MTETQSQEVGVNELLTTRVSSSNVTSRSNSNNVVNNTGDEIMIRIVYAPLPDEADNNVRSGEENACASLEFARRAVIHFQTTQEDDTVRHVLSPIHIQDFVLDDPISINSNSNKNNNDDDNNIHKDDDDDKSSSNDISRTIIIINLFIISCGRDGSVHRNVRKLSKQLRQEEHNNHVVTSSSPTISSSKHSSRIFWVVALLGHAVCKTYAEQAADEVYSSGRRFVTNAMGRQKRQKQHQQQQKQYDDDNHHPNQSKDESSTSSNTLLTALETQVELVGPEIEFDPWLQELSNKIPYLA